MPDPALPHPPTDAGAPAQARGWTALAMALATLDLSLHLFRNWVAFDEGAMGLAASLVRHGRWPHADFSDVYSGGLALLDAGAQWAFGDDLASLRIPFGILTILWVGLLAACFRRFVSAPAAAGLALAAYLWGPALYTAAMPSWYLLFLATALVWALFRWHESADVRWWGVAGLCIGLALFIKINALFLLAAAGSALLTDERYRGGVVAAVVVLVGVLGACYTVVSGWPLPYAAMLALPLLGLTLAILHHQDRARAGAPADLRPLLAPLGWLTLGLAAVIVPWVGAYAIHGGLHELAQGLFVLPFRRSQSAGLLPPPFRPFDLLPIALLPVLLLGRWDRAWAARLAAVVVALAFLTTDLANTAPVETVRAVWRTVRGWAILVPFLVALARYRLSADQARPVMIAGWIATWFALLQYPFAGSNYLAYAAPLLLLAGTAAVSHRVARPVGAAVAAALVIWTVSVDHSQSLHELGFTHQSPRPPLAPLTVARGGGILIPPLNVEMMTGVVDVLDRWGARTLVAGPDAPQLYYFSGRPLPDRELFEFLAPEWSAAEFARRIGAHDPDAVVLNSWAPFSAVSLDSVRALLPRTPIADTTVGPYRILLFHRADAAR